MTLHTQSSWNLETDLFLHTPFISPLCSLPVRFFFFLPWPVLPPLPSLLLPVCFVSFPLSPPPFSLLPFPIHSVFLPFLPSPSHVLSFSPSMPCPPFPSPSVLFTRSFFFPSLLPCHFLPVSSLSLPSHSRCPPIPIPLSFPAFPPISCLFPPSCPLSSPPSSFYSSPSSLSPFILSLQSPFPSSVHFLSLNGYGEYDMLPVLKLFIDAYQYTI